MLGENKTFLAIILYVVGSYQVLSQKLNSAKSQLPLPFSCYFAGRASTLVCPLDKRLPKFSLER
jgi:hypothetical protein